MIYLQMTSNKIKSKKSIGFGFVPEETQIHFLVDVPKADRKEVRIFDCTSWKDGKPTVDTRFDSLKAVISQAKWSKIKPVLAQEFNSRLKIKKYSSGKWNASKTPVHRLLGKEMLILVWAVTDCDPSVIDTAVKNWLGLRPEERWWLYTMTNATSGSPDDNFGWRKALRYALTENPIIDSTRKPTLFVSFRDEDF